MPGKQIRLLAICRRALPGFSTLINSANEAALRKSFRSAEREARRDSAVTDLQKTPALRACVARKEKQSFTTAADCSSQLELFACFELVPNPIAATGGLRACLRDWFRPH